MLADPQNEDRCAKLIAGSEANDEEKKNTKKRLVKKSNKSLKVRKTILKEKHVDIVGWSIGPKGLNLRSKRKVHVAKINDTNHPDVDRTFKLGDVVYWACNICAGNVSQVCPQCETFIEADDPDVMQDELDLEEFHVEESHTNLLGRNMGPPTDKAQGINLNNEYGIQSVGLSQELVTNVEM